MKKITFLLSLLISAVSFGQATDLYFSMYGEGSSSNKWLEIYNGTGADVDLSNYFAVIYPNGAAEDAPGNSYDFAGMPMLADGDVFVIANASADAAILAVADVTDDVTFFNGDDAVALYNDGTLIDLIGEIGSDPGSAWAVGDFADGSANHTLIRKSSVCSPNPNPLGSFGTDAASSEWEVYDNDTQWAAIGTYEGCDNMAVGDVLLSEFIMYPNPTKNGEAVSIQTVEGSEVNVTVFDILGKKVVSKTLANNEMNISGLKTGVYLVQVSQNGATVTKKLIVE